ncbi:MAG TPA: sensor histidine kinase, partial [Spirochaetota bacterium]|nr:sensor histidine kinase [Spirochaetota bacterium]
NLLHNAINALDSIDKQKKTITITTKLVNNNPVLTISDNGPGITPADQRKIFDPFYSKSNEQKTMGMGLYMIKNILNSYNATISLTGAPQEGATFNITFPNKKD